MAEDASPAAIPVLETRGTPYQRGLQHGDALRERIRALHAARPLRARQNPALAALSARSLACMRREHPDLVEEIEGIAAGAGLPFQETYWLSCFNAIGLIATRLGIAQANAPLETACSAILLRGPQGVCLGKSSDVHAHSRQQYVLERSTDERGVTCLRLRWGGNVWTEVGVNSHGLAAGVNAGAVTLAGQDGAGLPMLATLTPVLQRCATVAEAVALLARTVVAGKGLNIALADARGQAAVVEKAFRRQGVVWLRRGADALYTTNHCVTPPLQGTGAASNSRLRYDKLARLLPAGPFPDPLPTLQALLADHTEPGPICQHGASCLCTRLTSLLDPLERAYWLNGGSGCQRAYVRYAV